MTRSELEALVLEATGRTDKTSLIRLGINLALREISSQRLWTDLQTEDEVTIAASATYVDLATDLARPTEMRVIDGTQSRPLRIRPKTWLIKRVPDPSSRSTGRPTYGYIEGKRLYVIPIPDAEYTIRYTYFKVHPDLSSDSDEVLIRGIDGAVVAYATYWVFHSLEKTEDAKVWYQTYEMQLRSTVKLDSMNPAIEQAADQRGNEFDLSGDYWLDPFVRSMP